MTSFRILKFLVISVTGLFSSQKTHFAKDSNECPTVISKGLLITCLRQLLTRLTSFMRLALNLAPATAHTSGFLLGVLFLSLITGCVLWFCGREPLFFLPECKGISPNCHLYADGLQISNYSVNPGLRLSYPTAYCTSPHGYYPLGDSNLIFDHWFGFSPQLSTTTSSQPHPRSSFLSLSPVNFTTITSQIRNPGDILEPCLCFIFTSKQSLLGLYFFGLCDTQSVHFLLIA